MVVCPKCLSTRVQRRGYNKDKTKFRYECQESHEEYVDENTGNDYKWFMIPVDLKQEGLSPKILLWDIENSGMLIENVWNLWEPRINYSQVVGDAFILSWSAKWLFDDEIFSDVVTPSEAKNRNDKRVVSSVWKLLDQADIIIAHNGDGHDVPKMNTRFVYYKMNPPMYDRTLDTLKIARQVFSFPSNSLNNINKYLGMEEKIHNEPGLWELCLKGDKESLEKLKIYNNQDVLCVESLYLRLLPWIKNHPSWLTYGESDGKTCPQCGKSGNIVWRDDKLNKGIYKVARCGDCGAPIRSNINQSSKEKRKNILKRI